VVVVGLMTVGIVHPSKLYGALAAGRVILAIGPNGSPAAELVRKHEWGWVVEHGDTEGLEASLTEIAEVDGARLQAMGDRAYQLATGEYSREALIQRVVALVTG
jgi:colanic acid biosynthesis glycosyl transferase WcaI